MHVTPANQRILCLTCVCVITLCASRALHAQPQDWLQCAPPAPPVPGLSHPGFLQTAADDDLHFSATEFTQQGARYLLRGDVVTRQGQQEMLADQVEYDADSETLRAQGDVRFQRGDQILRGETAFFQLAEDHGRISPAQFWLTDRHGRGSASEVVMESRGLFRLSAARYTTCDEGSDAWSLRASTIELDREAGRGYAYNARLTLHNVPVFYFPYISFPIDDRRKTGFLMPSIGYDSISGLELKVPYYWNIAPQYDATVTPRFMNDRGLLLDSEFRYLHERSHGQITAGYLSNDKLYGDDRATVDFQHRGDPAPGWRSSVEYRYASDADYLRDFDNELASSGITHLERRADLAYQGESWRAGLLVQDYQTLDETLPPLARPYRRLPQLLLGAQHQHAASGLLYSLESEWVRFDRAAGVQGSRLDLQPALSWPWRGNAGFLVPTFKYRYTAYQLERSAADGDASPTRSVPIVSLDSGLVFERELDAGGRAALQTLEPRVYFLYVPYRDQERLIVDENDDAVVFDSAAYGFSLGSLFRDNRYSGADRVGDARQISLALTSRLLDVQGRELLNASVGRAYYLRDRLVTLPGEEVQTASASDWLASLTSQWSPALSARATLLWDTQADETAQGTFDVRYLLDHQRVLRLGYRYTQDTQEQVDVAGLWPLSDRWGVAGRWLHSLRDGLTLETLAGLVYQSCCWNLRLVQQRFRDSVTAPDFDSVLWLQLELKGLASVGDRVDQRLARDILAP